MADKNIILLEQLQLANDTVNLYRFTDKDAQTKIAGLDSRLSAVEAGGLSCVVIHKPDTLPAAGETTLGKLYLLQIADAEDSDYAEYVTVKEGDNYRWEQIGTTKVELADYVTKEDADDTYSPIEHDHDSAYAAIGHNHDEAYAAIDHSHNIAVTPATTVSITTISVANKGSVLPGTAPSIGDAFVTPGSPSALKVGEDTITEFDAVNTFTPNAPTQVTDSTWDFSVSEVSGLQTLVISGANGSHTDGSAASLDKKTVSYTANVPTQINKDEFNAGTIPAIVTLPTFTSSTKDNIWQGTATVTVDAE